MAILEADGLLTLDFSAMSAFAKCSTMGMMRYWHGYRSPQEEPAPVAGAAVHEALATYFKTGSEDKALGVLHDAWEAHPWDEELDPDHRLNYVNVTDVVEAWLERNPLDKLSYKPIPDLVEIGFVQPISDDPPVSLAGRIDAVVSEKTTGALYILDHKTTWRLDSILLASFTTSSQFSGYIWGALKQVDARIAGCYINAIEVSKLPRSTRTCPTHKTPYTECKLLHAKSQLAVTLRSPEQLVRWRLDVISLANRIRDLINRFGRLDRINRVRTQGTFTDACKWCPVRDWCMTGKDWRKVEQMLVHDPWEPVKNIYGGEA